MDVTFLGEVCFRGGGREGGFADIAFLCSAAIKSAVFFSSFFLDSNA